MTGHGRLAGVLFDMDGTLLDSERLWSTALDALAERLGGVLSLSARQAITGTSEDETMAILYADLGIDDPDSVGDRRFIAERMAEFFATKLTWRPGARELVAEVRAAGLPAALVTSANRHLVEIALASTLSQDSFDTVVCADDVTAPKPHPEAYRTAAGRLGVPIRRCVAIEDSPAGLTSARRAGAVPVGVPGDVPLSGLDGVHLVSSLAEVDLAYLARLVDHR